MQNTGLSVLLVLATSLLGGCRDCGILAGDLPRPTIALQDEILLDVDGNAVLGCWMLKQGDDLPRANTLATVDRRAMVVQDGNWDDPLERVGLTRETCRGRVK